jgi:hypothetical protein
MTVGINSYELELAGERRNLNSIQNRQTLIHFGLGGGALSLLMIFSGNATEFASLLAISGVAAIAFYYNDKTEVARLYKRIETLEKLVSSSRIRRDSIVGHE